MSSCKLEKAREILCFPISVVFTFGWGESQKSSDKSRWIPSGELNDGYLLFKIDVHLGHLKKSKKWFIWSLNVIYMCFRWLPEYRFKWFKCRKKLTQAFSRSGAFSALETRAFLVASSRSSEAGGTFDRKRAGSCPVAVVQRLEDLPQKVVEKLVALFFAIFSCFLSHSGDVRRPSRPKEKTLAMIYERIEKHGSIVIETWGFLE